MKQRVNSFSMKASNYLQSLTPTFIFVDFCCEISHVRVLEKNVLVLMLYRPYQ